MKLQIHIKIHLIKVCFVQLACSASLIEFLGRFAHVRKNICLTHIFSQINAMIDIAVPIPRNINAGNQNLKKVKRFTNFEQKCLPI